MSIVVMRGSREIFFKFRDPLLSPDYLKLETLNLAPRLTAGLYRKYAKLEIRSVERLTVITAARRNGRVPRRPQGRCSPRQLKILVKLAF